MKESIKHFEILKKPILTEQTFKQFNEENKIVIEVDVKADRSEVKRAFEAAFPGSKVEKVNIILNRPRTKRRGRFMSKIGLKKKAIIKISKDSVKPDIFGYDN